MPMFAGEIFMCYEVHRRPRGRYELSDDNIIKFERRKPKKEQSLSDQMQRKALTWIAVIAVLVLVWAYYQFIAPPSLP
ncbi:hypothetical protein ABIA13_002118 [Sinorhizobium fredii]